MTSPLLAPGSTYNFLCYLVMILPQVGQLFSQAFDLHLQVSLGQGQFIQHPTQAVDVSIHALAQGYFILIPEIIMM